MTPTTCYVFLNLEIRAGSQENRLTYSIYSLLILSESFASVFLNLEIRAGSQENRSTYSIYSHLILSEP